MDTLKKERAKERQDKKMLPAKNESKAIRGAVAEALKLVRSMRDNTDEN